MSRENIRNFYESYGRALNSDYDRIFLLASCVLVQSDWSHYLDDICGNQVDGRTKDEIKEVVRAQHFSVEDTLELRNDFDMALKYLSSDDVTMLFSEYQRRENILSKSIDIFSFHDVPKDELRNDIKELINKIEKTINNTDKLYQQMEACHRDSMKALLKEKTILGFIIGSVKYPDEIADHMQGAERELAKEKRDIAVQLENCEYLIGRTLYLDSFGQSAEKQLKELIKERDVLKFTLNEINDAIDKLNKDYNRFQSVYNDKQKERLINNRFLAVISNHNSNSRHEAPKVVLHSDEYDMKDVNLQNISWYDVPNKVFNYLDESIYPCLVASNALFQTDIRDPVLHARLNGIEMVPEKSIKEHIEGINEAVNISDSTKDLIIIAHMAAEGLKQDVVPALDKYISILSRGLESGEKYGTDISKYELALRELKFAKQQSLDIQQKLQNAMKINGQPFEITTKEENGKIKISLLAETSKKEINTEGNKQTTTERNRASYLKEIEVSSSSKHEYSRMLKADYILWSKDIDKFLTAGGKTFRLRNNVSIGHVVASYKNTEKEVEFKTSATGLEKGWKLSHEGKMFNKEFDIIDIKLEILKAYAEAGMKYLEFFKAIDNPTLNRPINIAAAKAKAGVNIGTLDLAIFGVKSSMLAPSLSISSSVDWVDAVKSQFAEKYKDIDIVPILEEMQDLLFKRDSKLFDYSMGLDSFDDLRPHTRDFSRELGRL